MDIEKYLSKFNKVTENPTLEAMEWIMNEFGNPHKKLKFIHVAGTNGKGSICEMMSNILKNAGYKVGKFISPHLIKFNDTILVNNVEITDDEVSEILENLSKKIDIYNNTHKIPVKWFEVITSLALIYFAKKECDIVVLETGLGGRTDCTNIVDSTISIIANIGYDHMDILGKTIEEITSHKAGIIKENSDTVMLYQEGITPIIEKECMEKNAKLHVIKESNVTDYEYNEYYQVFNFENYNQVEINLKGKVQIYNAAICIKCVEILNKNGYTISEEAMRSGLKAVVHKARFETLSQNPLVIFDGGHNENAIKNLIGTLTQYYQNKDKVFIVSILKTKDYKTIIYNLLKQDGKFIFTSGNDKNRYVSKEDLLEEAKKYKEEGIFAYDLETAINKSLQEYKNSVICIIGSFYVYADVKNYLNQFHN